MKDDAITFTGFSKILKSQWVKRGMNFRFEIPLSKEILIFLLEYFKYEEHLDISCFELIQYQGYNEIDVNTEECRKLMGNLRGNLIDWIGTLEYKLNGFDVIFDSDEMVERKIGRKQLKYICNQMNNNE